MEESVVDKSLSLSSKIWGKFHGLDLNYFLGSVVQHKNILFIKQNASEQFLYLGTSTNFK